MLAGGRLLETAATVVRMAAVEKINTDSWQRIPSIVFSAWPLPGTEAEVESGRVESHRTK